LREDASALDIWIEHAKGLVEIDRNCHFALRWHVWAVEQARLPLVLVVHVFVAYTVVKVLGSPCQLKKSYAAKGDVQQELEAFLQSSGVPCEVFRVGECAAEEAEMKKSKKRKKKGVGLRSCKDLTAPSSRT